MTLQVPTADLEYATSLQEPLASWWWQNVIGDGNQPGHVDPYSFYLYIAPPGQKCTWCEQAIGLLNATGSPFVPRYAHKNTFPYPTVPQAFFGRRYIGGFESLAGMLNDAGRVALFEKIHPDVVVPMPASDQAAGYDIQAYLEDRQPIEIPAGSRALIGTGFKMVVPMGTYGRIAPRSGLANKYGAQILAGVIDRDYRGEVKVILRVDEPLVVNHGDRIAQVIFEVRRGAQVVALSSLDATARGAGGFGSTGT